jgi:hypothetical protein
MVLSEDGEDKLEEKYDELCLDLNMDRKTKEEAWKNYEKIKKNYTLEVNDFRKSAIFSQICVFCVEGSLKHVDRFLAFVRLIN